MSAHSQLHEDLGRFSAVLGKLWTQLSHSTDPRQVESQYDQILQLDAQIQHNVNILASRMRKQDKIRELHDKITKNTQRLNKFFLRGQALEHTIQETLMDEKTPFMRHYTTRADLIRYYTHVNALILQSYAQDGDIDLTEEKLKEISFPAPLPPHSPQCTCTRGCQSLAECVCPCVCVSTPFATPLHSTVATLAWYPNKIQPSFTGFEQEHDSNNNRILLQNRNMKRLVELANAFDVVKATEGDSNSVNPARDNPTFPTLLLPQIDIDKLLLKAEYMAWTSSAPYVVLDNRWPTNTSLTSAPTQEEYSVALMHRPLETLLVMAREGKERAAKENIGAADQ